jgi:hypothetical protein
MTSTRVIPMRTRAVLARCPRCKAPVLAGYDDDGLMTRTDPTPITRTAELALHLAGHPTHTIDHGELVRRDRWRIRRPTDIALAPHTCDPLPTHALAPVPTRPEQQPLDGDVAPF